MEMCCGESVVGVCASIWMHPRRGDKLGVCPFVDQFCFVHVTAQFKTVPIAFSVIHWHSCASFFSTHHTVFKVGIEVSHCDSVGNIATEIDGTTF